MTADTPSTTESLSTFANAATPPAERRAALTALITAKVLPKQAEEDMLYREMRDDLVQQMVRRLAAVRLPR